MPMNADFSLDNGIAILERTPAVVRTMLAGLPAAWLDATEGPDTWSPYFVVGHLVHGERADWIRRAQIILAQGADRQFTPFDRKAQFKDRPDRTLEELLDEFARLRAENLETLRGWQLTESHLGLTGEHPEFGTVTLRQLLSTWVAHDLGHLVQISRVMQRQYTEAVGPWRAYLSTLR